MTDSTNDKNFIYFIKKHFITLIIVLLILVFLLIVLLLPDKNKTIIEIGDVNLTKNDYNVYMFSSKYKLYEDKASSLTSEDLNKEYSEGITLKEYLNKKTINELIIAGIVRNMANDNEIKLTSEDKKEINENKQKYIVNFGGQDKYKEIKKKNNFTDTEFNRMLETDTLYNLLIEKLYSDGKVNDLTQEEKEEAKKEYYEKYYKVQEIVISKVDLKTNKKLSKKELNQKKELANSIYNKAKNNESFIYLISNYSDEQEYTVYFTKDDVSEDIFNNIKDLKIDEISNVIEDDESFRIIKRIKLDDKKIEDYYDTYRDNKLLNDIVKYQDNIKIKYKEEFYKLK